MSMARFEIYANPNPRASHSHYLDVQSNFVQTSTRWCVPLFLHAPSRPIILGAQVLIEIGGQEYVLDAPNLLAVPAVLLRQKAGQLAPGDQLRVEACIEFMLRGY